MSELKARLAQIAARERAAMERGATVAEVLRRLREEDELGGVERFVVLRTIKHIGFGIAKQITADYRHRELDLDDLALLASIPQLCTAARWLTSSFEWAVVERRPRCMLTPSQWGDGPMPPGPDVAMMDCGADFARYRDELKRAIADEPAWRRELAIERDDDEAVVVRFVRVPPRR